MPTITAIWSVNFLVFLYQCLEAIAEAVTIVDFCFDFVAIVVYITLLNPWKVLFMDPVNTNTELDLLIRILSPLSQILL